LTFTAQPSVFTFTYLFPGLLPPSNANSCRHGLVAIVTS